MKLFRYLSCVFPSFSHFGRPKPVFPRTVFTGKYRGKNPVLSKTLQPCLWYVVGGVFDYLSPREQGSFCVCAQPVRGVTAPSLIGWVYTEIDPWRLERHSCVLIHVLDVHQFKQWLGAKFQTASKSEKLDRIIKLFSTSIAMMANVWKSRAVHQEELQGPIRPFQYKDCIFRYRDLLHEDKTVMRLSLSL